MKRSILLVMAVSALMGAPHPVVAQGPSALPAVSVGPTPRPPANRRLSPNDLVEVKVFQEDDMDWTVRVAKDGSVTLPVVGQINVVNKTSDELGSEVVTRLKDGYLVHPQVNVTVLEFSKQRFTILGQVQRPGQVDFPDNASVNLLQAIGMAGGFTKAAAPSRVYVKRRVGSRDIVLTMDAKRMARNPTAEAFQILPDDTITVEETIF